MNYHGELYGQQLIYEHGLTNPAIARRMKALGIGYHEKIIADAAEPKSIDELRGEGFFVVPSKKGADSVMHGISKLNAFQLNLTADSQDWWKEQRNYTYQQKDGRFINKPIDKFDHCWNAARYAVMDMRGEDVLAWG